LEDCLNACSGFTGGGSGSRGGGGDGDLGRTARVPWGRLRRVLPLVKGDVTSVVVGPFLALV